MGLLEHNEKALSVLQQLCAGGRLPHALLLEGPEGCGKKTLARYFCMCALCEAPQKPCGVCPACQKVERGVHPDVLLWEPTQGRKEFTIDLIREIRQDAYIAPNEGNCKIYILDRAHTMNPAAQNALLKILEEPPASTRFVLLCENRSRMLVTILSRVTSLSLNIPSPEQCAATLGRLRPDLGEDILRAAAAGAGGNVGRALLLLDTAKPSKAAADAARLRELLFFGERYEALRVLATYEKEREDLARMLSLLRGNILELAVAKGRGGAAAQTYERFLNRFTLQQLLQAGQAVERAQSRCQRNASIGLLSACLVEDMKTGISPR